ncbi:putative PP2A regulatory subunit TAP46-like [Capsicum annuum]|nr:putative PP2A regulatory subunit TAP46-like [Capsicum annuum]
MLIVVYDGRISNVPAYRNTPHTLFAIARSEFMMEESPISLLIGILLTLYLPLLEMRDLELKKELFLGDALSDLPSGDVDVVCGEPPCQGISGFNRFRNKENPMQDRMNYQARMGMMAAGAYGLPQFCMRVFMFGALSSESNIVVYDEDRDLELKKELFLGDALSDLPSVENSEPRDEMTYTEEPKTHFQRYIILGRDGVIGSVLYDHRSLQLNDDDHQRVCQIPKRKGANFRTLTGVRVRPDKKVEWDPDVERVLLPSGKPLVPDYVMSFVGGSSSKSYLPEDVMLMETPLSNPRTMWMKLILPMGYRPYLGSLRLIALMKFYRFPLILLQMLVTSQSCQLGFVGVVLSSSEVTRVSQLMRLSPPTFTGFMVEEYPQGLIDEMENIFKVMHSSDYEVSYSTTNAPYPKLSSGRHFQSSDGPRAQGVQSQTSGAQSFLPYLFASFVVSYIVVYVVREGTDISIVLNLDICREIIPWVRRFVESFSSIAAPLTKLTQKKVKFLWSNACEGSFEKLKDKLTLALILTLLKVDHLRPAGLSQEIELPVWKCAVINMDFVTGLLRSYSQFDSIWVIMDRMTKSAHFLLVRTNYSGEDYTKLFIREIIKLHGAPVSIISDRVVLLLKAPFKALYGRRCRSPIGWFEVSETRLFGPNLVHQPMEKVKVIKGRLKSVQSRQKFYADVRRRDLEFDIGDWVFLKVSPMKGVILGSILPVFHVLMLKKCVGVPFLIVSLESVGISDSFSYEKVSVEILDRQVHYLRTKDVASVEGPTEES